MSNPVMNEDQEARLKTALGLDGRRKIPQEAMELWRDLRISLGRLGQQTMTTEMLALIPVMLNRVVRPTPQTFLDEVKENGDVKFGTRVVAKFRNAWHAAQFIRLEKGKVVVVLDDDTAEKRSLGVTAVRLATNEDLEKLGEK